MTVSADPHAEPPTILGAPLLRALAAQALGFFVCFGAAALLGRYMAIGIALPLLLAGQGVVAAAIGVKWRLARWWLPVHLVAPSAAGLLLALGLPSWVFLAAFVVLWLVFSNAGGERVPLYLSNRRTWAAIDALLPAAAGARFVDLGSGVGGLLIDLAGRHPEQRFVGVESAPAPLMISKIRRALAGGPSNLSINYGDIWAIDLGDFDVVYCFLSPAPMARLFGKAVDEMRPGSLFVSNSFAVPRQSPDRIVEVDDRRRTKLLIWEMPVEIQLAAAASSEV